MEAEAVHVSVVLDPHSLTLPYEAAVKYSTDDNVVRTVTEEGTSDRAQLLLCRHSVRATVVLETTRKIKMRRLEAEFVSKQLVADEDTKPAREYSIYRKRIDIVTSTATRDCIPLSPGRHEFPVIFEVPSWLPATLTSYECRIGHFVRARVQIPASSFFALKPQTFTGLTELVLQHRPPPASNAMRYWAGERRSSASHIAVRTARYARIGGRLKFALSVKAHQAVEQCRLDLIQDERSAAFPRRGGLWSKLPAELCDDQTVTYRQRDLKNDGQRVATYPLPTIRTDFPAPAQGESAAVLGTSQPDFHDEESQDESNVESDAESAGPVARPAAAAQPTRATVSNLTLVFRVLGDDLKPDFESPLFQCSHRLRLRLIMRKDPTTGVRPKQVVFTIPVRLFEGDATCDDVPPSYDEIHEDYTAAMLDAPSANGLIRVVDQDDSAIVGDETNEAITDYETDDVGSEASPILRQGGWADDRRGRVLRRRSRADSVSTLPLYEPPTAPEVVCIDPPESYEQAVKRHAVSGPSGRPSSLAGGAPSTSLERWLAVQGSMSP